LIRYDLPLHTLWSMLCSGVIKGKHLCHKCFPLTQSLILTSSKVNNHLTFAGRCGKLQPYISEDDRKTEARELRSGLSYRFEECITSCLQRASLPVNYLWVLFENSRTPKCRK
ncbi:Hypothetical predicted protein, partial [Mytilus galloprovincialis]